MSSTRETLIAVAARLLDAGGPAAVTLRAVGEAAGVSHNAPYRHFADKTALLAAIAARELEGGPVEAGDSPTDIETLMRGYVRWAAERPERFKLTFGRWEAGSDELAETATAARGRFVDAVARAQADGRLPRADPERLTALLLALAHGAADLALSGHLARAGKGRAHPEMLLADLFEHLARSAASAAEATRLPANGEPR
jgi:AcrR family transcriptional regulator